MFTTRIKPEEIEKLRIEAEFYQPEKMRNITKLKACCNNFKPLSELCEFITDGTHQTPNYVETGVRFLSSKNIGVCEIDFDDTKFVTTDAFEELKRSKCAPVPGDILISKNGKIGTASVFKESHPRVGLFVSVALLRYSADIDVDFLAMFLNSNGGWWQFSRSSKTGVITNLHLEEIREVEVPLLHASVQKYIGDKVRQAERLRAWAKALDINIASYFAVLVANPLPPRVSWLAKKEDLDPYRINPKQYDPVVLELIHRAKANGFRLEPLSGLTGTRQIAGGATPKGAQYFDKGVLFARVQNVKPLRLDLSDAVYIDQSADEELARSRCSTDDIILTITGYPGTASLVTEEDLPVNINQHSVRFNIRDDIEPGYVCAALNSKFLKYQVDRLAIGGTRDALDYPSVGRLLIPRYEAEVERKIGEQARSVIAAEKLSQRLTNAAKLLVEALIEGQVTEVELIAAEQALQTGNDQLDRHILSRLKTDGIDGQGQPLFSDLDQLYSLVEQASQS